MRIAIFISSLLCYLEWGGGNTAFLIEAEYGLFTSGGDGSSFSHPLVMLPFIGQVLILISFLIPKYNRKLMITGIFLLSFLILMIFFAGILCRNVKSVLSTLPFIGLSIYYILSSRKKKRF